MLFFFFSKDFGRFSRFLFTKGHEVFMGEGSGAFQGVGGWVAGFREV